MSRSIYLAKKFIYPKSAGIIAQTSLSKEIIFSLTKHKNINVIPNPVKKININSILKKEKIILNMGRLVPEKDQENLIHIFSLINQKNNGKIYRRRFKSRTRK